MVIVNAVLMASKRQSSDDFVPTTCKDAVKRSRRTMFCPHCDHEVSRSTYYEHHTLHYDRATHVWRGRDTAQSTSDADFVPGSSSQTNPLRCNPSDGDNDFVPMNDDHPTENFEEDSDSKTVRHGC